MWVVGRCRGDACVARFELLAGARKGELEALDAFCSALRWMTADADVTRTAGALA